jgi:ABC-type multidrug transport system ATPase subunit
MLAPMTTTTAPAIEATGLTKVFGTGRKEVKALDGLDLAAPSGKVTAVLGPNGAGKSTFVRSVATLLRPDGGALRVSGVDAARRPEQVRRLIGLAGQFAAVEPALTGRENLVLVARLFGHDRRSARAAASQVLAQLGLDDAADRLVRGYSGGMRRRLDLGASLVGGPRLLLLDEPTTGLDPRSRIELWQAIRGLVHAGTDVLLTTQYLDEADQLADVITVVDHGRAVATGTPEELKGMAGRDVIEIRARQAGDLDRVEAVLRGVGDDDVRIDVPARRATVAVDRGPDALATAVRELAARRLDVDDVGLRRPTLDEVFLALTGRPAADAA